MLRQADEGRRIRACRRRRHPAISIGLRTSSACGIIAVPARGQDDSIVRNIRTAGRAEPRFHRRRTADHRGSPGWPGLPVREPLPAPGNRYGQWMRSSGTTASGCKLSGRATVEHGRRAPGLGIMPPQLYREIAMLRLLSLLLLLFVLPANAGLFDNKPSASF